MKIFLLGFMLLTEVLHYQVPKGYIYFAVFFTLFVEVLNMKSMQKKQPILLGKRLSIQKSIP